MMLVVNIPRNHKTLSWKNTVRLCKNRSTSSARAMDYKSPMLRFQSMFYLLLVSCLCAGCLFPGYNASSDSPADSVISANVEAQLAEDRLGGLSHILVATEGGTVILTGTVQKAERKARAAELAREVKGVKRVKNDLEIRAEVSP